MYRKRILGLNIALETGPVERFAQAGNYAFYCYSKGSTHVSNGKQKGKGNTKNGNKYLAWEYVEAGVKPPGLMKPRGIPAHDCNRHGVTATVTETPRQ